jgi:hypothetical protein
VRYVEILMMFAVLDRPEDSLFQKLQTLWQFATLYGSDRSLFDIARDVLSVCAASLKDIQLIEKHFKEEFKPRCFEYAVTGEVKKVDWAEIVAPGKKVETAESRPLSADLQASKPTLSTSSSVKQQFNICEGLLNADMLVEVLQACPLLLKEIDAQLSARLLACYGRDERYKEPEVSQPLTETLDFSWIMKKSAPKREVFGLY